MRRVNPLDSLFFRQISGWPAGARRPQVLHCRNSFFAKQGAKRVLSKLIFRLKLLEQVIVAVKLIPSFLKLSVDTYEALASRLPGNANTPADAAASPTEAAANDLAATGATVAPLHPMQNSKPSRPAARPLQRPTSSELIKRVTRNPGANDSRNRAVPGAPAPVQQPIFPAQALEPVPAEPAVDLDDFHRNWETYWQQIGARGDGRAVYKQLMLAYAEPKRQFHGLQMLSRCLGWFEQWRDQADHSGEVALAIWFKEAVFDPFRHDNEARSARMAMEALSAAQAPSTTVSRVRDLIVSSRPDCTPMTDDARLFSDIDLSFMGAAPLLYSAHEQQIRAEHAHVSDYVYRKRRAETLKGYLLRNGIYQCEPARSGLEAQARANLATRVALLQSRG